MGKRISIGIIILALCAPLMGATTTLIYGRRHVLRDDGMGAISRTITPKSKGSVKALEFYVATAGTTGTAAIVVNRATTTTSGTVYLAKPWSLDVSGITNYSTATFLDGQWDIETGDTFTFTEPHVPDGTTWTLTLRMDLY